MIQSRERQLLRALSGQGYIVELEKSSLKWVAGTATGCGSSSNGEFSRGMLMALIWYVSGSRKRGAFALQASLSPPETPIF